ncbi:Flp pilus assembly protein CpaB [Thermaurantiacus sp.]
MPRRLDAEGPARPPAGSRPAPLGRVRRPALAPRRLIRAAALLATALLLAAVAAVLSAELIDREVDRRVADALAPLATREVLVAARDLSPGRPLTRDDVRAARFPASHVSEAFIAADPAGLRRIEGRALDTMVPAGAPLLPAQFEGEGRSALARQLRPGMRAVALPLAADQGLARRLAPGDRVDFVLTTSRPEGPPLVRTALRNLRILGPGADAAKASDGAPGLEQADTILLEVTPAEAEALALFAAAGTLRLLLRSGSAGSADRGVDRDALAAALAATRAAARSAAAAEPAPGIPPSPAAGAGALAELARTPAAPPPAAGPQARTRVAGVEIIRGSSVRGEAAAAAEPPGEPGT